jgi:hypothetical protein
MLYANINIMKLVLRDYTLSVSKIWSFQEIGPLKWGVIYVDNEKLQHFKAVLQKKWGYKILCWFYRGGRPREGATSTYGRTPVYGGQTPMYGSRTPMYGSQTPLHDGSRTPHYGSQTPSHEPGNRTPGQSAWDPANPNTPAR